MSLKLRERIEAFSRLGSVMQESCSAKPAGSHAIKLRTLADRQYLNNPWFTSDYVQKSISALSSSLNTSSLDSWLMPYSLDSHNNNPKRIEVVMAGNIPLVGFHDFLSVLVSGNIIMVKASSKDRELIESIAGILTDIEPGLRDYILLSVKETERADAVIATGSNNTSRYFEYNYGHLPHIFRKNRNSVALIHPGISDDELMELGKDVFYYYGLGCRNVSKIYLPYNFDIKRLEYLWKEYSSHLDVKPYLNNYKYNRALCLVQKKEFHDLGYLLLEENQGFASPVSVLYYSRYRKPDRVLSELAIYGDSIQAIVGEGHTPFGQAQYPALNDYADGIDTIDFLQNL